MLASIARTGLDFPLRLVYGVTHDDDLVCLAQLDEFVEKIPGFSYRTCVASHDSKHERKGYVTGYRIGTRVRYKRNEVLDNLQRMRTAKHDRR